MLRIWGLLFSRCRHAQQRDLVSGRSVMRSTGRVNENHCRGSILTLRETTPKCYWNSASRQSQSNRGVIKSVRIPLKNAPPAANPIQL
jgi:hypothetical protein